jgi:hypothetical protein
MLVTWFHPVPTASAATAAPWPWCFCKCPGEHWWALFLTFLPLQVEGVLHLHWYKAWPCMGFGQWGVDSYNVPVPGWALWWLASLCLSHPSPLPTQEHALPSLLIQRGDTDAQLKAHLAEPTLHWPTTSWFAEASSRINKPAATWEGETGRIAVQGQPGQKKLVSPYVNK